MSRIMHDDLGRPVMYVTAHLAPRHSRTVMEIPGDAIDTFSAAHIVRDPAVLSSAKRRTRAKA